MFKSKLHAIKEINSYVGNLQVSKELVEEIMALGVEDFRKDGFVKEQLALITKLQGTGE